MNQLPGLAKASVFSLAFVGTIAGAATAPVGQSALSRDEQVRAEIRGQAERLKKEARNGDTAQFDQMIAEDYAEFNPFFPFLVDPPKPVSVAMEKEFDAHDRLPPTDRSHKIEKIQVYGDVALLTFTSIAKGTPVEPGFMAQAKFLSIYVKMNGVWTLVQSHDARRTGPDGLPID